MLSKVKPKFFVALLFVALTSLMTAACATNYEYKGVQLDPPLDVPDFELSDSNMQTFRLSDQAGDIVLVFFGYTFCPDVCPLTLADVKKAMVDLDQRDRVKVVFISVDPERDTPEAMREYVSSFDPEFIGLTDDYAKIQEVMKPFGAYAEKEQVANSVAGYLVNHTARLYLISPEQKLLLTYSFGFNPKDLRSDLDHLLSQLPDNPT